VSTEFAPPEQLDAQRAQVHAALKAVLELVGVILPKYVQGVFIDLDGITVVELPTSTGGIDGLEAAGDHVVRTLRHYVFMGAMPSGAIALDPEPAED
jgi:hypothetical protein